MKVNLNIEEDAVRPLMDRVKSIVAEEVAKAIRL